MARLRRLNKKTIEMICDAIAIGSSRELAAKYAGVSLSVFMLWMQQGREEHERLVQNGGRVNPERRLQLELLERVEDATAQAGIGWVQVISNAADKDPAWARWMLEVHFPEQYSAAKRLKISGEGEGGAINVAMYEQTWARRWEEARDALALLDSEDGGAEPANSGGDATEGNE